jgi:hypothetical protein
MALQSLTYGKPSNFVSGSYAPVQTWGTANLGGRLNIPAIGAVDYELWSGSGTQVGKADVLLLKAGTLTSVTPGTTDLADIDLQTALDVSQVAASIDEVVHLVILSDTTNDGTRLVVEPGATNGFTAPFQDMAAPADGKLSIPAGFVHPTTGTNVPGGCEVWGGNLTSFGVDATHKVLRVRLVAGTTANYRLMLLGRSAAS